MSYAGAGGIQKTELFCTMYFCKPGTDKEAQWISTWANLEFFLEDSLTSEVPKKSSLGMCGLWVPFIHLFLSRKQVMKEKCAELINVLESMLEEQTWVVREDL